MKFAPVAPINVLEELHKTNDLGHYHLVLTHDVIDKAEQFHNLFAKLGEEDGNTTVIVDNSVIELDTPLDPKSIVWAGEVFEKACRNVILVLPDALINAFETIQLTREALDAWKPIRHRFKFMFVPQGRSLQELVYCAEQFKGHPDISHIGVARNITQEIGSRAEATHLFRKLFPGRTFHFLGFSDDLRRDVLDARGTGVVGIDSAVPLRMGTKLMRLSDGTYPRRDPLWWDSAKTDDTVRANIRIVREWFNGQ